MVAPIITFLIAGFVFFFAFQTSRIETGMEEAAPAQVEVTAEDESAEESE